MARLFNDAASDYLEGSVPISALPFTISCWFNTNDDTIQQVPVGLSYSGGTNYFFVDVRGEVAGDHLEFHASTPGGAEAIVTVNSFTANTWQHGLVTVASATDRNVVLNGDWANRGTGVVSVPWDASIDKVNVGCVYVGAGRAGFHSGLLAECAIWDAALTQPEVESLAEGYSPALVRPSALVWYPPIIGRTSPEIEIVGGLSLTVVGAVVADHPRVFYPSSPQVFSFAAVVNTAPIGLFDPHLRPEAWFDSSVV